MALLGQYTDDSGTTQNNAYASVIEVNCNWLNETANCVVVIFRNENARRTRKRIVAQFNYDFHPQEQRDSQGNLRRPAFTDVFATVRLNARNPVKATYEYVKTLPEWTGWTDDLKAEVN